MGNIEQTDSSKLFRKFLNKYLSRAFRKVAGVTAALIPNKNMYERMDELVHRGKIPLETTLK